MIPYFEANIKNINLDEVGRDFDVMQVTKNGAR